MRVKTDGGLSDAELWAAKTGMSMIRKVWSDNGSVLDYVSFLEHRLSTDRETATKLVTYLEASGFMALEIDLSA
jgi:hypothetical protein